MNGGEQLWKAPSGSRQAALALALVGVAGLVLGVLFAPDAAAVYLLLVGFFGVCLGLAGALVIALQQVTGATWGAPLRRVPEALISLAPAGALLLLIALFAFPGLYPWNDPHVHLHGDLKHAWLQRPFFLGRAVAYLAIWILPALALVRAARRQGEDPGPKRTVATRRWSALFLVLFGATFWLACYDWLMSREPDWVSAIYGLYNFAGLFTSGLAVFILAALWLRRLGPYRDVVTGEHLHDLGKLLFAMCVFWLYLWFCQYMLIWFVNIPEETPHYVRRMHGHWATWFHVNVALNGVIPFFVLLPRSFKRNPKVLANVCAVVLVGHWLDLFLMIFPEEHGAFDAVVAVLLTLGAAGLDFLAFCRALTRAPLVPDGAASPAEHWHPAHHDGELFGAQRHALPRSTGGRL